MPTTLPDSTIQDLTQDKARNPLTGRQILKRGALYRRLQREGRIPDDPQTASVLRRQLEENRRQRLLQEAANQRRQFALQEELRRRSHLGLLTAEDGVLEQMYRLVPGLRAQVEATPQRLRVGTAEQYEVLAAERQRLSVAQTEAQREAAMQQRPAEQPSEPCVICMKDSYTDPLRLRECGHTYCYECIKYWHTTQRGKANCPTCRVDIQRNPALA